MAIKLYDLAGAEPERRFSPFCWRARLALAHKGLPVETIPWRFTEKDAIAFSGQERVPVMIDGAKVVSDSWAIATYLEQAYPDRPSLFGGEAARIVTQFVNAWADNVLHPAIARLVVIDVYDKVHAKDRDYFRTSRESRYPRKASRLRESRFTGTSFHSRMGGDSGSTSGTSAARRSIMRRTSSFLPIVRSTCWSRRTSPSSISRARAKRGNPATLRCDFPV